MRIFFLAVRGDDKDTKLYTHIVQELKSLGHKVDADWMKRSFEEDAENFQEAYKRNMQSIKQADLVVAEVSKISSGLGFQIATALSLKKPTLALYNKDLQTSPSSTILGSSKANKNLVYLEYNRKGDIKKLLSENIEGARQIMDTKFILIIPAEIDRYLEWASDYKRMHKAQLVREAIEKYMDKDDDWKEFLED